MSLHTFARTLAVAGLLCGLTALTAGPAQALPPLSDRAKERIEMREWLDAGDFAAIEARLAEHQAAYEADPAGESRLDNALVAFDRPDHRLTERLYRWAGERSGSYVARLAYATHLASLGQRYRGTACLSRTPRWRREGFERFMGAAMKELEAAVGLATKSSHAHAALISIARTGIGDARPIQRLDAALKSDPFAYGPLEQYRYALHPSWIGRQGHNDPWGPMESFVRATDSRLAEHPARQRMVHALLANMLDNLAAWAQDEAVKVRLLEDAAKMGSTAAVNDLAARKWESGQREAALKMYEQTVAGAPERGSLWNVYAQALARIERGAEAGPVYARAAELGDSSAQRELGAAYARGDYGFKRDPARALYWYSESAHQGNTSGMVMLGRAYYDGFENGKPNDNAAWRWWREAERWGDEQGTKDLAFARSNNRLPTDPALLVDPPNEALVPVALFLLAFAFGLLQRLVGGALRRRSRADPSERPDRRA